MADLVPQYRLFCDQCFEDMASGLPVFVLRYIGAHGEVGEELGVCASCYSAAMEEVLRD